MTVRPARVTVVGLGPGDRGLRTIAAQQALDSADRIVLRTRVHPGLEDLGSDPRVTDCDDLYQSASEFGALYSEIAQRVLQTAVSVGPVVFAVPGHPRIAEKSVPLIEAGARALGITVDVQDAVSFADVALGALKTDPAAAGLQILDAEEIAATVAADPFASGQLRVEPTRPLLIAQMYNPMLASAVKIALSRVYPDEHPVILVHAAGVPAEQSVRSLPLHALDRQAVDHLTSLWIPPLEQLEAVRSPDSLVRVVARLRSPEGCPWDREQTPSSLRNAVLEEAYEVVDAIDADDDEALAEELGDLLLLVVMQAQIAEESDAFRIEDVVEAINRKLIRRHPHVFGSVVATTPDAVVTTWEGVKATERAEKGEAARRENPVDRLPRAMPITRKIVELLAPRASLGSAADSGAGDESLMAIRSLVERGIDPEIALEASLRRAVAAAVSAASGAAVAGTKNGPGRESA